ncbi:hypothetical protein [Amycolatopsis sp. WGS_07]|uniref:hypothetical protein n=1 Tax=Amycolatopsis sp. WGS_07 TaxID=3076764 RepID=UPI003872E03E
MKTGLDKGGQAKAGLARVTPAAGISAAAPDLPGAPASSAPSDGPATLVVPGNSAPGRREIRPAVEIRAGSRKRAGRCPGEWEPRIRPGGG